MEEKTDVSKNIRICLIMIEKNENHVMYRASIKCVTSFIDVYCIDDTGSTDGSKEFIREYFNERDIPGILHEESWTNFSHNRTLNLNHAYEYIEKIKKPDEIWYMFTIDADDYIFAGDVFKRHIPIEDSEKTDLPEGRKEVTKELIRSELAKKLPDIASLNMLYQTEVYGRACFIKYNSDIKWRYLGVVHEGLFTIKEHYGRAENKAKLEELYYVGRREGDRSKDPTAIFRDAQIMELELFKGNIEELYPGEGGKYLRARYYYYIAQSYKNCRYWGRCEEFAYKAAMESNEYLEQRYVSWLLAARARLAKRITRKKENPFDQKVNDYFTYAINNIPARREAPYWYCDALCTYSNYEKAYEIGSKYINEPDPEGYSLFIDGAIINYRFDLIMGLLSVRLGHVIESKVFFNRILLRSHEKDIPSTVINVCNLHLS